MRNTEIQKFEERWQQAFEGAEMTPSDSVWSNIDLKLDNEKMKRRVVYYQRLAAAAVLFALLIGIGGVRYFNTTTPDDIALKSNADLSKSEVPTTNPKESQNKSIAENNSDAETGNSTSGNHQSDAKLLSKDGAKNEYEVKGTDDDSKKST